MSDDNYYQLEHKNTPIVTIISTRIQQTNVVMKLWTRSSTPQGLLLFVIYIKL